MHYIRFLKTPLFQSEPNPKLKAKITITTDLGESYLQSNITILVALEHEDGTGVGLAGQGRECFLSQWEGRDGMRSLDVSIPTNNVAKGRTVRMHICPYSRNKRFAVEGFASILEGQNADVDTGEAGGIIAVRSMAVDMSPGASNNTGVRMAERVFTTATNQRIRIWEETGESIARHIWDAGLVLSSYLASLPSTSSSTPKLPLLEALLKKPRRKVLELGAGCGIVGISLATVFSTASVLLTDLPEATSIITTNLSPSTLPAPVVARLSHQVLDWSSPLRPNIGDTHWDLILVADCTYNPDVVPDLVRTLRRIWESNRDVLICLAMKVRHESEMVFFDLMSAAGFVVRESCKIELPVLGGEGEEIEIFGFCDMGRLNIEY